MSISTIKEIERLIISSARALEDGLKQSGIVDCLPLYGATEISQNDLFRQQVMENFICNIPYYTQYPNPSNNPIVASRSYELLTARLGARLREGDNSNSKFNSGICIPKTIIGTFRGRDRSQVTTLFEKVSGYRSEIEQDASLDPDLRDEASALYSAMLGEITFYGDLAKNEEDNMSATYAKLVAIWVAKQLVDRRWGDFGLEDMPTVCWDDYKVPRNLYGSIIFDSPAWLLGPECLRDDIAGSLIDALAVGLENVRGLPQYRVLLRSEWDRYCNAAERTAKPNGFLISDEGLREHLSSHSVEELYRRFDEDVAQGAYPSIVQHKANFIFGLIHTAFTGNISQVSWPFHNNQNRANDSISCSLEVALPRIAPIRNAVYLNSGRVTIAINKNAIGLWSPSSKSVDLTQLEPEEKGMALLFAGREYDASKWVGLREDLRTAVHECFAPQYSAGGVQSVFEDVVEERIEAFFNKREKSIAGILEEASQNNAPFFVDDDCRLAMERRDPESSAIDDRFQDAASRLVAKWTVALMARIRCMYGSFYASKSGGCIDVPHLRREMEALCLAFYEEFGLNCLSNYSGVRYRANASGSASAAVNANFTKESFCEYLFRGSNSAASMLDCDLASVKSFIAEQEASQDGFDPDSRERLSASIEVFRAWRVFRKQLAKEFPKMGNCGLLGRIEYAVIGNLQSQYPGRAGVVMARTIMDFLFMGYLRWVGADRKAASAFEYYERDLQAAIVDAFDRYEDWERENTLYFGPELLEIYEQVKKDEFPAEDFRNIRAAGVPSSKHIVFFIDEKDPAYPLCALCLASSNGAMLLRGEEVPRFMLAESVSNEPRSVVVNRILRAMDFIEATDRQLVKEPIPLLFGDRIVIPVQRGVTINILHDVEGDM